MNTRVRAARRLNPATSTPTQTAKRRLKLLLHGARLKLKLKTVKQGSVILNQSSTLLQTLYSTRES